VDASVGAHPSADTLRAFGSGKLDDRAAQAVIEHLAGCATCARSVAAQSGDDFLGRLREAQRSGTTPVPVKRKDPHAREPTSSPPAPAVGNLPPGLAANAQYEVVRELGRGGMGVVYLARNRLLERLEVLKVVNPDLLTRAGGKERFLREIQAAAKLNHPNVVTAYNAMQLGDLLFFAMEYVEGENLAQVVNARGPLPVVNACYYVQQAALGLQHAWDKQMVHRDIKPQNLILARVGKRHVVKILDFGLAKIVREKGADPGLTGAGKMLGTPDYIAPEQTLDAAAADIRADIYSLGCTFYFLLTGRPPFKGNTLYAILQAHHAETATPVQEMRPEVPAAVAAVVARMMAKAPAERYQKPAEVAQALTPIIKAGGKGLTSAPVLMSAPAGQGAQKKPGARNETMIAGAFRRGTMAERPALMVRTTETVLKRPPVRSRNNGWLIALGVVLGMLCLVTVIGLWLGGVFRARTRDGAPAAAAKADKPTEKLAAVLPPSKPATKAPSILTDWGDAVDPDHNCTFALANGQLHIKVPGTQHDLSREVGKMNAPRMVRDVEGDFRAETVVDGNLPSDPRSLYERRVPFHGAGLLIWQDDENYIRLERAHAYYAPRGMWMCYPNWEARRQGQQARKGRLNEAVLKENEPVFLRVVRTGDVFTAFYTQDGQVWKELPAIRIDFDRKLRVGVCAIQNTPSPFDAVFADLKVLPGK
jgi:regulation of enolase protein 1 (concanavalin A-like superfamily)/predicted Ser/Thr protein kinase